MRGGGQDGRSRGRGRGGSARGRGRGRGRGESAIDAAAPTTASDVEDGVLEDDATSKKGTASVEKETTAEAALTTTREEVVSKSVARDGIVLRKKKRRGKLGTVPVFVKLMEIPNSGPPLHTAIIFWKSAKMKDKKRLKETYGKPSGKYYWAIHDLTGVVASKKNVAVTGIAEDENTTLVFKTASQAEEWAIEINAEMDKHKDDAESTAASAAAAVAAADAGADTAAAAAASEAHAAATEKQKQDDVDAADTHALKLTELEEAHTAEAAKKVALEEEHGVAAEALTAKQAEAVAEKKAVGAEIAEDDTAATEAHAKELAELEAQHAAETEAANAAAATAREEQAAKLETAKTAAALQKEATETSQKQAKASADAHAKAAEAHATTSALSDEQADLEAQHVAETEAANAAAAAAALEEQAAKVEAAQTAVASQKQAAETSQKQPTHKEAKASADARDARANADALAAVTKAVASSGKLTAAVATIPDDTASVAPKKASRLSKRRFGAAMRAGLKSGKLAAAVATIPDETADPFIVATDSATGMVLLKAKHPDQPAQSFAAWTLPKEPVADMTPHTAFVETATSSGSLVEVAAATNARPSSPSGTPADSPQCLAVGPITAAATEQPLPAGWSEEAASVSVEEENIAALSTFTSGVSSYSSMVSSGHGAPGAQTSMNLLWDDAAAKADMDKLPVARVVAALQLDCPLDLPLRSRQIFDAIESYCTSDADGRGWISRTALCDAVVSTLPYEDSIPSGQPARAFLVRYFHAMHAAHTDARGTQSSPARLPFSEACLGLALLLLCPTRASTPEAMSYAVGDVHRILTTHRWSAGGARRAQQQRRGAVLRVELQHAVRCMLSAEALLCSMVAETVSVDLLASAMCAEMMQQSGSSGGDDLMTYSAFRRWMLLLPHKLHPELASFLEDQPASLRREVSKPVLSAEVQRSSPPMARGSSWSSMSFPRSPLPSPQQGRGSSSYSSSSPPSRSWWSSAAPAVPSWWDYTNTSGARYYANDEGVAVWQMPEATWVGTIDEISGTPYWYHTATMERVWTMPLTPSTPARRGYS